MLASNSLRDGQCPTSLYAADVVREIECRTDLAQQDAVARAVSMSYRSFFRRLSLVLMRLPI
jgi:hypothetical protein